RGPALDHWQLIGMKRGDSIAQPGGEHRARLEQHRHFLRLFHGAVPQIERGAGGEDIGAGGEMLGEHGFRHPLGIRAGGEGDVEERKLAQAAARPPARCAPQTVAMTTSAPVSWWSAASQIGTPAITVAMPSRIWVPKALWIAIEARRLTGRTLRASRISPATATQAHQRWMKCTTAGSEKRIWPRLWPAWLTPGKKWPFISGH